MAKYTFICENEYGIAAKRMVEFEADSLDDILNEVEMFLRGAGFYFRGTLDVVTDEDWDILREDANFDFSEIPQNNWPFKTEIKDDVYVSGDSKVEIETYGAAQPVETWPFDIPEKSER